MVENKDRSLRVLLAIRKEQFVFGITRPNHMSRIDLDQLGGRWTSDAPICSCRQDPGMSHPVIKWKGNIQIFGQHRIGQLIHLPMDVRVA